MKAIYAIKNKENNKLYVGSATNFNNRWIRHRSDLNTNKHHNIHLQRAWKKYGADSFEFVILESVEKLENLISREQYYIDLHKSADPNIGYNIAPIAGSSLGIKHTKETKQKHSEIQIKRYKNSEERKKTGDASRKAWQKDGMKEAASKRMTERWADESNREAQCKRMKIITNDPELAKRRYAGLKKHFSDPKNRKAKELLCPHRRKIKHIETGDLYDSISHAARELPISIQTIKNNLKGKFKSLKGYNFIEVKDDKKR